MKNLSIILFMLFGCSVQAQNWEFKIGAGANFTFVPDFNGEVYIANDGLVVPNFIHITNSNSPVIVSESRFETKAKPGFYLDFDLVFSMTKYWKLSTLGGISYWVYDYDTYIEAEGTNTLYLSELDPSHGQTKLFYFNVKPLSISYAINNDKFELQTGPSINFLLSSSYSTVVLIEHQEILNGQEYQLVDKAYFKSIDEINKLLIGWHLLAGTHLLNNLEFTVSGEYYFNSVYFSENSAINASYSSIIPIQLTAGLRFSMAQF